LIWAGFHGGKARGERDPHKSPGSKNFGIALRFAKKKVQVGGGLAQRWATWRNPNRIRKKLKVAGLPCCC